MLRWPLLLLVSGVSSLISGRGEYCLTESFRASCARAHVLYVESASFGRMRLGRCATRDYGHVGCSKNVLPVLDFLCSGRPACAFSVSQPSLVRSKPCHPDFSSYLEARHRCVPVETRGPECRRQSSVRTSLTSGFLSSSVATSDGCGNSKCPWLIHVESGRRINLTLHDFAYAAPTYGDSEARNVGGGGRVTAARRKPTAGTCEQYALVEEPGEGRSSVVCGRKSRLQHVYTSSGNTLRVQLLTNQAERFFLIHYEAIGCPDLNPSSAQSHVRRDGDNVLHVTCNGTGETSTLECRDGSWVGTWLNCTGSVGPSAQEIDQKFHGVGLPPVGITLVIIIGVAMVVVVYVAVMIVCVLYMNRWRRRHDDLDPAEKLDDEVYCRALKPCAGADERIPMLAQASFGSGLAALTNGAQLHGDLGDLGNTYVRTTCSCTPASPCRHVVFTPHAVETIRLPATSSSSCYCAEQNLHEQPPPPPTSYASGDASSSVATGGHGNAVTSTCSAANYTESPDVVTVTLYSTSKTPPRKKSRDAIDVGSAL